MRWIFGIFSRPSIPIISTDLVLVRGVKATFARQASPYASVAR